MVISKKCLCLMVDKNDTVKSTSLDYIKTEYKMNDNLRNVTNVPISCIIVNNKLESNCIF